MAKSYKTEFMEVLTKGYKKYTIKVNGNDVDLFTNHYDDIVSNIDLDSIVINEGLKGKTKPIAIVQYFTVAPWEYNPIPMIAFIWSWGGPWAYIHNILYEDYSESGSVPYNRVVQSMNI